MAPIPARLIRTVPETTSDTIEEWWSTTKALHPGWETVTYRDPLDPLMFPLTARYWNLARSGAQLAGLVRLEALWHHGGIYLDSDVEVFRSLDKFRTCSLFAAWEDDNVVPDAVIGATPNHPVIRACVVLAIRRIRSNGADWRTGNGPWATGPGVTTTLLPHADGVTLFGPETFYPVHYSRRDLLDTFDPSLHPGAYALHHWHASWLPEAG